MKIIARSNTFSIIDCIKVEEYAQIFIDCFSDEILQSQISCKFFDVRIMATKITLDDFCSAAAGGVGVVAGRSAVRKMVEWRMNIHAQNGLLIPQCAGGHGSMVLVSKPSNWGVGRMFVCSRMQMLSDESSLAEILKRGPVTAKTNKGRPKFNVSKPGTVCFSAVDESFLALTMGLYKGKYSRLISGQDTITIPDPSQPCCCNMKSLVDSVAGTARPCCLITAKKGKPPHIGWGVQNCMISLKNQLASKDGSQSKDLTCCKQIQCKLWEDIPSNVGRFYTLEEKTKTDFDWVFKVTETFFLLPLKAIRGEEKKDNLPAEEKEAEEEAEEEEVVEEEFGSSSEEEIEVEQSPKSNKRKR